MKDLPSNGRTRSRSRRAHVGGTRSRRAVSPLLHGVHSTPHGGGCVVRRRTDRKVGTNRARLRAFPLVRRAGRRLRGGWGSAGSTEGHGWLPVRSSSPAWATLGAAAAPRGRWPGLGSRSIRAFSRVHRPHRPVPSGRRSRRLACRTLSLRTPRHLVDAPRPEMIRDARGPALRGHRSPERPWRATGLSRSELVVGGAAAQQPVRERHQNAL